MCLKYLQDSCFATFPFSTLLWDLQYLYPLFGVRRSGNCFAELLCVWSCQHALRCICVSTRWGSGTQQQDITDWVAPQPQRFSFRGANRSERRIDQSWFASHSLVGLPHFKEIYRARFKNGRSDLHCYPGATSETKSNLSWFQVRCQPKPHYAKTH